jgi:hypothetical protein
MGGEKKAKIKVQRAKWYNRNQIEQSGGSIGIPDKVAEVEGKWI